MKRRVNAMENWLASVTDMPPRLTRTEGWLARQLASRNIIAGEIKCTAANDRPVVTITLDRPIDDETAVWMTQSVGQVCGKAMQLLPRRTEMGRTILRFVPRARINLRIGRAEAASRDDLCGDAFVRHPLPDGRVVLILCDGMGQGKEAHALTKRILDLLETLFRLEIPAREALEGINLLLYGEEVKMASLEVVVADPAAGSAEWYKMGACPSLLLRNNRVTKLQGDALPAGAVEDARPAVRTVPLQPDDVLLLCSDGLWPQLTEGVQNALVQFLRENTPQAAAESLMSFATNADDALAAVIHVERAS